MTQLDEELKCLESMHANALVLAKSQDPLLRGQVAQILGAIEGLMTVIGAPPQRPAANAAGSADGAAAARR